MDGGKQVKRLLCLITAAILLLCLCSCGSEGSTLTYPLNAIPSTLDPQYSSGTDTAIVINNSFEGLTRIDENGNVVPGVASSWAVSEDGLNYTFYLRNDCRWTVITASEKVIGKELSEKLDASPVTADDFVFAFTRAVSQDMDCPNKLEFSVIKNAEKILEGRLGVDALAVKAVDSTTFAVMLETPCADFLERVSTPAFMPCNREFFEATGGRYGLDAKYIMCNGPFYIKTRTDDKLTMMRNRGYSDTTQVLPAEVDFVADSDAASVGKKVATGAYSAALLDNYHTPDSKSVTLRGVENTVYAFCFNCSDEYLSNKEIRQAICHCISRNLFEAPEGMKNCRSLIPPCCSVGSLNYSQSVGENENAVTQNPFSAASLWKEGLGRLEKKKINITITCPERFADMVSSQVQLWQQTLGITFCMVMEKTDDATAAEKLRTGEYQMILAPISTREASAADFVSRFKSDSAENVFRFEDKGYDLTCNRILEIGTEAGMLSGCYTAESFLLENGICFPLFSCSSYLVSAPSVSGITCSPSGDDISFISACGPD